jgi:hypothetical protein
VRDGPAPVERCRILAEPRRAGVMKIGVGSKVRDIALNQTGVVLDTAKQYAHPQARPVYNYLIRWQDGQVQAVTEEAFRRGYGIELVEEG